MPKAFAFHRCRFLRARSVPDLGVRVKCCAAAAETVLTLHRGVATLPCNLSNERVPYHE